MQYCAGFSDIEPCLNPGLLTLEQVEVVSSLTEKLDLRSNKTRVYTGVYVKTMIYFSVSMRITSTGRYPFGGLRVPEVYA